MWGVAGPNRVDENLYQVLAPEAAIFLVGRSFYKTNQAVDEVTAVIFGKWPFK